jgi:hypothetical protein
MPQRAPTAVVGGILLHSRYDPHKQAGGFIRSGLGQKKPGTIILLGAGLGYLVQALRIQCPRTRLICLYYSEELFSRSFCRGDDNWHPRAGRSIIDFLYSCLDETDVEGLESLEWPPSKNLFPGVSRSAHDALRQVVRELSGSVITTVGAGRLWIRNTIFNFLCLKSPLGGGLCQDGRPIAIMASGPSLEEAYPLIRRCRRRLSLWALPSALGFCRRNGIIPDLVIVTDPGYYSTRHFLENPFPKLTVAMPFSACRGLWNIRGDIYLFAQPSPIEKLVLAGLPQAPPMVPFNGTVAGTALLLALKSSQSDILFLGLDMCFRDIFAHARPGSFEIMLDASSHRLSPLLGTMYSRAVESAPRRIKGHSCRTSPAYATYSGWFARLPAEAQRRVRRLKPSPADIPGMRSMHEAGPAGFFNFAEGRISSPVPTAFKEYPRPSAPAPLAPYPSYSQRKELVTTILRNWLDELRTTDMRRAVVYGGALLDLLYFTNARMLLEYKRRTRLGDTAGAEKLLRSLRDDSTDFISGLLTRITPGVRP